jgi:4-hydroxybenzoate polyprenyltransferase
MGSGGPPDPGGRLTRAWALVRCSHPEPVATVAILCGLLALAACRGWGSLWVVAAVGAGQLAVGWHNDWIDRERDYRSARKDKPLVAGSIEPEVVGIAAAAALLACVPLSLASGLLSTLVHMAALAFGFAYNAGLKATLLSPLAYAGGFGLLPAVVTLGPPGHLWPPAWLALAGALLGVGAHFAQVLPDIAADRRQGLIGLPQLLGQRASASLAAILMLLATLVATFGSGPPHPLQIAGLALVAGLASAVVLAAARGRVAQAFRLTLAAAAIAVLAFLAGGRTL